MARLDEVEVDVEVLVPVLPLDFVALPVDPALEPPVEDAVADVLEAEALTWPHTKVLLQFCWPALSFGCCWTHWPYELSHSFWMMEPT